MANNRYQGTGRRKTSVARVTLVPGSGKFTINKKDISEYFNFDTLRVIAKEALELTNNTESYDVTVNVKVADTLVKQVLLDMVLLVLY